jgi:hypothetical protein
VIGTSLFGYVHDGNGVLKQKLDPLHFVAIPLKFGEE